MTTAMAEDLLFNRRANLSASRSKWSRTDASEIGKCNEDAIEHWLTSIIKEETKPDVVLETAVLSDSKDDNLALGVEASLYGKRSIRTVQSFLRASEDLPSLSRWNSLESDLSTQSKVSVMDVLDMLQDDPEELLLDLGFGIDEPDITGRIPARFLCYQSNARGISFQLFLEAQQSRIDVENPDVRSRFREIEVLQQVTATFTNLVGASSQVLDTSPIQASMDARERRKRVASILRRAAKKTTRQAQKMQDKPPTASSAQAEPESSIDKRIPSKRSKVSDDSSPFLDDQSKISDAATAVVSGSTVRVTTDPLKFNAVPSSMGKGMQEPMGSFELEKIRSSGVPGNSNGPVDPGGGRLDSDVIRTNNFQSDSSSFLEDPPISQHNITESELRNIRMLNGISQENTTSRRRPRKQKENIAREPRDFEHTDSPISSVLGTADSGSINNIIQSHTVLGTAESDSAQMGKTQTEKENLHYSDQLQKMLTKNGNSESSLPDDRKMSSGVTLAYYVQMDPVVFPTELRDRFQSTERVYKQSISLFEELQSAETISSFSPTEPETGDLERKVSTTTFPHEDIEQIQYTETSVCDQIGESQTATEDQNVNTAIEHSSPTSLKLRRESFSRRSRSDGGMDNDSGMHSPFTSVETSSPHMWNSMERSRDLGYFRTRSMSLDTGLSHEEEDQRWECALLAGTQRCFYCGSLINDNRWAKIQRGLSSDLPYSLDELENTMRCMRKFRNVLTEIEVRVEEEQASVLGSLSESHREELEDVLRLRAAVKQEAGVLEQQLSDIVDNYDDSIKMKLNRLLDEQSQLCSQLRIVPADTSCTEPKVTRSVAVQCCLLPVTSGLQRCCHHHCTCHTHHKTWQDPYRSPNQTQWDSYYKPDRLDFIAFMKSLKNSLQLSLKSTSLEQ
ncbi:uncharacterized protein itprid1 [Misgurnus anguillicaudatus]|uniref:uncharacterized protein itprid1 n=1 Tax=Misgurnus anguillicaudatus TaxID=75329 RepID=UPI003CCF81C0